MKLQRNAAQRCQLTVCSWAHLRRPGRVFLGLVIYRLYLSPISNFPGPKLAACTLWYEFYFDVVKRGRYTWKIGELHEEYGECTMVHCVSDCSQLRERTYHPDQSV
jgi:hypothetical protein